MAQDEEESKDFDAFPGLARGDDTPVAGGVADEAEQVYVDRRAAECIFMLNFMEQTTSKMTR
jgi:hypothetical protein